MTDRSVGLTVVQVQDGALGRVLAPHLVGPTADGSAPPATAPPTIVWVDGGDEVVVYLDSLQTRILDGVVVMSLDLEADNIGRSSVVVRFAVSDGQDAAGLVCVADEIVGGHPVMVARWGYIVQRALWTSLLSLVATNAAQNNASALGISAAVNGGLGLHFGDPIRLVERTVS